MSTKSKNLKHHSYSFFSLLPYPIIGLTALITALIPLIEWLNLGAPLYFIIARVIQILIDTLYLSLVIFVLISITKDQSAISKKKILLISFFVAFISWLYYQLGVFNPFYDYGENKIPPPLVTFFPGYIYNIVIAVAIPSLVTLSILAIIFKILKVKYFIFLALVTSLLTTQWSFIPSIIKSSKIAEQHSKIAQAGKEIVKSITHQIINEEIVNDQNSKYKSLRINAKLSVIRTGVYAIGVSLTDDRSPAIRAYVNGKITGLTGWLDIDLNEGENLIAFDFPYIYFNEFIKGEAISLPYKDTPTGSYGPYTFRFDLDASEASNPPNVQKGESVFIVDPTNFRYSPPTYTTKAYSYTDFYQE